MPPARKLIISQLLCFFFTISLQAFNTQDSLKTDSNTIHHLEDIEIVGYIQPQIKRQTPTSVGFLTAKDIELQSVTSIVPAMNTIPGVRMEERSPGSYRLSIRGSLVRSPYGIRNVKVYYNDFALTDAGGNTYLNVLNVNDLSGIEILKGPDGSLFGANSGGVVLLKSNMDATSSLKLNAYSGSFGLFGESVYWAKKTGKHFLTVRQSYQRADGYRDNTKNYRLFFQLSDKWQYNHNNYLEAFLFYSDLDYKTPGGLTKEQYNNDPRQSRPSTATMPGSKEQKTRISTRMYFGGIKHKSEFASYLSHNLSVWANHVDFVYPFITNYEIRDEANWGLRTYLTFSKPKTNNTDWNPSLNMGFELQRLATDAYNYDNHGGQKGDIQAYNNIINLQYFGFLRGRFEWKKRLTVEAAVSLNYNKYHFKDITNIKNTFPAVWMPHIAVNYRVSDPLSLRFIFSKGYSTPTTAEIRPSDNRVHKNLYAEQGWNTEAGIRLTLLNGRVTLDASGFHYLLKDGIISQVDTTGNTFFVNSGKIKQLGIEASASWIIIPPDPNNSFFKQVQFTSNYTYSHFKYDKYQMKNIDYSGNRVAGIPRNVWVNNLHFNLPADIYLFVQNNFTSRIPLDDKNSVFADSYNLLSAKLGVNLSKKYLPDNIYIFADNILNEKYSLGNDLNAVGGRYYNAAPSFNFQIGFSWNFGKD